MFQVIAHRTAGSVLGAAESPVKGKDDKPLVFDTRGDAHAEAKRLNDTCTSPNVFYSVRSLPG